MAGELATLFAETMRSGDFTILDEAFFHLVYGGKPPGSFDAYIYVTTKPEALKKFGIPVPIHLLARFKSETMEVVASTPHDWMPDFSYVKEPTLSDLRACLGRPVKTIKHEESDFTKHRTSCLLAAFIMERDKVVTARLSQEGVFLAMEHYIRRSEPTSFVPLPMERFIQIMGGDDAGYPSDLDYLRVTDLQRKPAQEPTELILAEIA